MVFALSVAFGAALAPSGPPALAGTVSIPTVATPFIGGKAVSAATAALPHAAPGVKGANQDATADCTAESGAVLRGIVAARLGDDPYPPQPFRHALCTDRDNASLPAYASVRDAMGHDPLSVQPPLRLVDSPGPECGLSGLSPGHDSA